ncbi:MAG TPA: SDR family NAD(P)-dependent oxidoreductase [Bryobacteraceae bacterium]
MDTARTVAVITGASSGIGAEFARRLAPEHDLLLIARRRDRLEEMAGELSAKYGSGVETCSADLTVDRDLVSVAERIAKEERLMLLVNSAGFGAGGLFWEAPVEVQEKMHRLHIIATMRLTHAALGNLVRRNTGAVINVASISAWLRRTTFIGYAATKSWMTTFSEGLYLDLRQIGSKTIVQALCPGLVYTEFHDRMDVDRSKLGRANLWQTAEDIVDASLEGLRRRKLFVIPGWRYRILISALSVLPTTARMELQRLVMRGRG